MGKTRTLGDDICIKEEVKGAITQLCRRPDLKEDCFLELDKSMCRCDSSEELAEPSCSSWALRSAGGRFSQSRRRLTPGGAAAAGQHQSSLELINGEVYFK